MVEFGTIPTDGNFSGWRSFLADKVGSCDNAFQSYSLKWGQGVFSSFDNADKAAALETALDGGSVGSDYLFPKRGGEFAFVVIGIVLLVCGIVGACALTKGFRKFFSRCFCGRCRDRDRVRMKDAPPHDRSFLCVAHIVACLSIIVLGVLSYISTAQTFTGLTAVKCNMWEQVYGHFFGTSALKAGDYDEVAFSWRGTHEMLESIADIRMKATPDANGESPIYQSLQAAYLQMRANATAKSDDTIALMQEFMDNATIFDQATAMVNEFAKPLTAAPSVYKGQIFQEELNSTLATGWVEIERILEQYAGGSAQLTSGAVESANASSITVQQVDLVIAQLAKTWDNAVPLLNTLVYLVGSLEIVGVSVGIVLSCLLMWLTFKLLLALRQDVLVDKNQRICWAVSYGTLCVLSGLFALLCSVHVLTAGVGSDACLMAEDALFTRGNWDILGEHILHPVDDMQVDVKAVLDTCVRADGNGDVASALGLDGRIRLLAEDVVAAQADVDATREALLDRAEKGTRAQVLALGFHDVAQMVTIGRSTETGGDGVGFLERMEYWNETRFVRADMDSEYAAHGPRSVLCLVPRLPYGTAWALYTCLAEGLQMDVAPMNVLADNVNDALRTIGITDGSVPLNFCSKLLQDGGHACAGQVPTGSDGWITGTTPTAAEVTNWRNLIDATTFVQNSPEKDRFYHAGAKFNYSINLWQQLEAMAEADMDTALVNATWLPANTTWTQTEKLLFCPDQTQTCSYQVYRERADEIFQARSQEIYPTVLELFSIVDGYVDDVVNPTMESLVNQANGITSNGNCQFEGTALHYSVLPPACEAVFPANAIASIFTGLLSVIFGLLAVHVWKWHHYLADLANAHGNSATQYEMTKEPSPMSENKNFLLYSGVPTSAQSGHGDDVENRNTNVVVQQSEAVHATEPASPGATTERANSAYVRIRDANESFATHQS